MWYRKPAKQVYYTNLRAQLRFGAASRFFPRPRDYRGTPNETTKKKYGHAEQIHQYPPRFLRVLRCPPSSIPKIVTVLKARHCGQRLIGGVPRPQLALPSCLSLSCQGDLVTSHYLLVGTPDAPPSFGVILATSSSRDIPSAFLPPVEAAGDVTERRRPSLFCTITAGDAAGSAHAIPSCCIAPILPTKLPVLPPRPPPPPTTVVARPSRSDGVSRPSATAATCPRAGRLPRPPPTAAPTRPYPPLCRAI